MTYTVISVDRKDHSEDIIFESSVRKCVEKVADDNANFLKHYGCNVYVEFRDGNRFGFLNRDGHSAENVAW